MHTHENWCTSAKGSGSRARVSGQVATLGKIPMLFLCVWRCVQGHTPIRGCFWLCHARTRLPHLSCHTVTKDIWINVGWESRPQGLLKNVYAGGIHDGPDSPRLAATGCVRPDQPRLTAFQTRLTAFPSTSVAAIRIDIRFRTLCFVLPRECLVEKRSHDYSTSEVPNVDSGATRFLFVFHISCCMYRVPGLPSAKLDSGPPTGMPGHTLERFSTCSACRLLLSRDLRFRGGLCTCLIFLMRYPCRLTCFREFGLHLFL